MIDDLPVIDEIYWTKNGNKIDTQGNEGKYSKVSVDVPSLTIYNVNQYDAGHYTLAATNAAGTTVSDAIILGMISSQKNIIDPRYQYYKFLIQRKELIFA